MAFNVTSHWYRRKHSFLAFLLLPLSLVFGAIVVLRRYLYQHGWKKIHNFAAPVIVVGNITVGGTGKTPIVIWLANYLIAQGYKPGIVSRGYGGKGALTPQWVNAQSDVSVVGDEAILLASEAQCPVVVARDRVAAANTLLQAGECNVVISDDGLQHYRLGRQVEIAMIDGMRRFGNQSLLPAGPLREPVSRLQQVDFVLTETPEAGEFTWQLKGEELVAVANPVFLKPLGDFAQQTVHAVAGIGNPQRFFARLRARGLQVIEHVFPDHYFFTASDLDFPDALPIIMTAKDAVKCKHFATERCWYLPVTAEVDKNFAQQLLQRIGAITCV